MKKIILFAVASLTVMVLTLNGCTEKTEETPTTDNPSTSKPTFFPRIKSN